MRSTVAAILGLLLATATAGAQNWVEPMGWGMLKERLLQMSPSEAQQEHIASAHDAYLEAWADLREEKISPMLEESTSTSAFGYGSPADVRAHQARIGVIQRRIANLDDELFASIELQIGDSQARWLDRLRERRRRDRARVGRGSVFGRPLAQVEPRDHIDWSMLNESQQMAVESTLGPWEDRLTIILEQWQQATGQAAERFAEMSTTLAETTPMDFDPEHPPTPEVISGLLSRFQEVQREANTVIQDPLNQYRRHVLRGLEDLAAILPVEQRIAMLQSAGGLYALRDRVPRAVRVIQDQDLGEPQRVALDAILEAWNEDAPALALDTIAARWEDDDTFEEHLMKATEEGMEIQMPEYQRSEEAREAWNRRQQQTLDDIKALLPADQQVAFARTLEQPTDSPTDQSEVHTSSTVIVIGGPVSGATDEPQGSVVISSSVEVSDGPMNPFGDELMIIPGLSRTMIGGIARDLQLDASGKERLEDAYQQHDDARMEMQQARVAERIAFQENIGREMMALDTTDRAKMMEVGKALSEPISTDGLAELDEAFFTQAAQLTDDPGLLEPWMLFRERMLMCRGGGMFSRAMDPFGLPDDRWKVDVLHVIESAELSEEDHATARMLISDWHDKATDVVTQVDALEVQLEASMMEMLDSTTGDGGVQIDFAKAMEVEKLRNALTEARADLATLNQLAIDGVIDQIADVHNLQHAWLKGAFPRIVAMDPFDSLYERAMAVEDLMNDQRVNIAEMRLAHREQWWLQTQAAVDVMTTALAESDNDEDDFEDFAMDEQRMLHQIDEHLFQRQEAALKRLERLRTVLTQAQRAQAGGLADPPSPAKISPF